MVMRRIRKVQPGCSVEVLIPDFKGNRDALKIVMDAQPEILNHNVEKVPRLFRKVQPQDHYDRAITTLRTARDLHPWALSKSGRMVRLGKTFDEDAGLLRYLAPLS